MCEMMGDRKRSCDVSSSFISSTGPKTHNVSSSTSLSRVTPHPTSHNRGPHTSTTKPRTCQYCRPQSRIIRQPDLPCHQDPQPSVMDHRSAKGEGNNGVSCMVFVWPQPRPKSQTLAHHLLLTFGIWSSHLLDLFTLSNLWPGDVQLYTRNIPWSVPPPKPPKPMTYNVIEPDW